MYFIYILQSKKDGSLYTGQTNNLADRFQRHNRGAIKATKSKRPYSLGYYETYSSRSEAMHREWQLKKKWNTERKKRLIADFDQQKIKEIVGFGSAGLRLVEESASFATRRSSVLRHRRIRTPELKLRHVNLRRRSRSAPRVFQ